MQLQATRIEMTDQLDFQALGDLAYPYKVEVIKTNQPCLQPKSLEAVNSRLSILIPRSQRFWKCRPGDTPSACPTVSVDWRRAYEDVFARIFLAMPTSLHCQRAVWASTYFFFFSTKENRVKSICRKWNVLPTYIYKFRWLTKSRDFRGILNQWSPEFCDFSDSDKRPGFCPVRRFLYGRIHSLNKLSRKWNRLVGWVSHQVNGLEYTQWAHLSQRVICQKPGDRKTYSHYFTDRYVSSDK